MKLNAKVESVTPEMATELGGGQVHNRAFSRALAEKYKREMDEGRWRLNGEPIIISDSGKLLDGQHRLNALADYGKPLDMLVVRGVAEDAFSSINTGRSRSGKDVLSIEGVPSPRIVAAIVKLCLQYDSNTNLMAAKIVFSNDEVLAYYRQHQAIVDRAAQTAARVPLQRRLCMSAVGLLVVRCAEFAQKVDQFLLGLETGANLEPGNPILTLRNRLERERDGLGSLRICDKVALLTKAWNAWLRELPLPKITFAPEKETFPVLISSARQLAKAK